MAVERVQRGHKSDAERFIVSSRYALEDNALASAQTGEALVYGATTQRGDARVAPAFCY